MFLILFSINFVVLGQTPFAYIKHKKENQMTFHQNEIKFIYEIKLLVCNNSIISSYSKPASAAVAAATTTTSAIFKSIDSR